MKTLIQKISPAIIDSRKIKIRMEDGHKFIAHPHIVIRKKEGDVILKTMLDSGDCMDIPVGKITSISILPESFAIDTSCLSFDYDEYELVFPKKGDWFEIASGKNKNAR